MFDTDRKQITASIRVDMNIYAIIMVGLPGLGKSTFISQILEVLPGAFVYSTDNFIERLAARKGTTYNDEWAANIKGAQEYMDRQLSEAIQLGKNVIFDQTNLSAKKRKSIISRMKKDGYIVNGVVFCGPENETQEQIWKDRLKSRVGKTIPANILSNMAASYVEPSLEEGFNKLTFLNMFGAPNHKNFS